MVKYCKLCAPYPAITVEHTMIILSLSYLHSDAHSLADFDVVGEQCLQVVGLTERDLVLEYVLLPHVVHHGGAVLGAERSHVTEEGGAEEAVSQQPHSLLPQVLQLLRPPDRVKGQRSTQPSMTWSLWMFQCLRMYAINS